MLITRTSPVTGKAKTMEIEITESQLKAWRAGAYIQDVAPLLSADEREVILTGILPEEWDELFS